MKIIIGADIVPTKSNLPYFVSGNTDQLIDKQIKALLLEADYRIFNLEIPLTDRETPIPKCGPALCAPSSAIRGYQSLGMDLLTLANNHILDQGESGLLSSIDALDKAGIAHVGAGNSINEAKTPYIIRQQDKKIGIYACASHEFSVATPESGGANPFDAMETPDHINALKSQCDYIIVLYHGGREHYRYPSPELQRVCRKMIEKGANLVVCQHSHCIGCEEKYQGGTILYGQGNFLFDYSENPAWKTSLLAVVDTDSRDEVRYIPLVKNSNAVRLADETEARTILSEFEQRSREIETFGVIQKKFDEMTSENIEFYLANILGLHGDWMVDKILNKMTGYKWRSFLIKRKLKKSRKYALINYFECEQHRELILRGLKK